MKNTILMLSFLAASTCMAATKITYDEIPKHLGRFGTVIAYRGFTVTTTDAKTHSGRRLLLEPDHLRIFHRDNWYEDLPGIEVTRIEVRQAGRFFHHVAEDAQAVKELAEASGDEFLDPIGELILLPPVFVYTAATTPFFLAADGVAFFIPPKVYEIVH
jgi:hypothetical protein